ISAHEQAEQPLINTHPIAQQLDSVQLMTTYKAKGLEFEHVFLLSLHDDIWGKKARGNTSKLSLPANLQHIRYRGSSEDELRRLLFVAITRAKCGLYLTSHATKDNGASTEAVKYLQEYIDGDTRRSAVLPAGSDEVSNIDFSAEATMQAVETLWNARHLNLSADLKSLLQDRLSRYIMSPTHLNTFIDTDYGGPSVFLLNTLLRFPQAPGEDGEFGNAIHATLDWYQKHAGQSPTITQALDQFDNQLAKRYISRERMGDYRARGHHALKVYLQDRANLLSTEAKSEVDFRKEGVILGEARLSGKLDRIEIDPIQKTIDIVDFKTGKPAIKWDTSIKLQKYKQQLYFYKLLIEGSHSWTGYTVNSARLEFVEPLPNGSSAPPLYVQFSDIEMNATKELIAQTWAKIMTLDLQN
ncbi:MAG TPA: PD-(D/E)XK nuclease family protein, partial [Candidatus Saccharibacteria bacterium]|nr:PD-(D/E)XK nuclease family protein [Candidatus Saccharibacteria bacterium]